jgi:hypothetical protein
MAQVGIGTFSPNAKSVLDLTSDSKGLLIPRLTSDSRLGMGLTAMDAGMLVYQTNSPKGIYLYDGMNWIYHAPMESGPAGVPGHTLRWDGGKWASVSNLFNQGTAIGIGISAPNTLLQIHTLGIQHTRIQLTNAFTGALVNDGLLLGIGNTLIPGVAHIIQLENKPLWIGTNGLERMRIDSSGKVGINQSVPIAQLDVNGTMKIGAMGSVLQGVIKMDAEIDPPSMADMEEWVTTIACPGANENAAVYVSPGAAMTGIMIAYARVSSPGNIDVKLMNMSEDGNDPAPVTLHIAVIQ